MKLFEKGLNAKHL